ncbi:uncharacterized protein LOC130204902 isoform X2 [Pseudoliparis swirei]|uniref:uncharacterized protein LOC130204902 isoform X2 n=1 Tax=Pseudoliparis swirei TaxID=2059687 RepID=UPI0024BE71E0|nr:uncharacterized protein LOC130204902 isoform X2 [Pseudoliparis swirei]
MLKFHSVFLCLMVIMFNRDQAALLSLLLINMCHGSEETSPLSNLPYILTAVIGFLLVTAVGLYSSTKFPNQLQERETLSYVQFRVYSGEEVHAPLQPHSCAEYRTNHKHVGTSRGSIQYVAL